MKKRISIIIISVVAVFTVFFTVAAVGISSLSDYLIQNNVGEYYLNLLNDIAEQYDFTDNQLDIVRSEAEKIIDIVKHKNMSFLDDPTLFSDDYTKDELNIVKNSFYRMAETVGFTCDISRSSEADGDVVLICDEAGRLLLQVRVADESGYVESSVSETPSENSSNTVSDNSSELSSENMSETSSETESVVASSALPDASDESYSGGISEVPSDISGAVSVGGTQTKSDESTAAADTKNPKTGDGVCAALSVMLISASALTVCVNKRRKQS